MEIIQKQLTLLLCFLYVLWSSTHAQQQNLSTPYSKWLYNNRVLSSTGKPVESKVINLASYASYYTKKTYPSFSNHKNITRPIMKYSMVKNSILIQPNSNIRVYRLNKTLLTNRNNSRINSNQVKLIKLNENNNLINRYRNRYSLKQEKIIYGQFNPTTTTTITTTTLSTTTVLSALRYKAKNSEANKNETVMFLTRVIYYINKLEKELLTMDQNRDLKIYGKKFYNLVREKLRASYDEMRMKFCNSLDDDFNSQDGLDNFDFTDDKPIYYNNNAGVSHKRENLIEKMYKREQKRRTARFSKKRFARKICYS
jgi:hypothetical protein